jgi:septal ring factor EnvC (AmiA/AmiB activator)
MVGKAAVQKTASSGKLDGRKPANGRRSKVAAASTSKPPRSKTTPNAKPSRADTPADKDIAAAHRSLTHAARGEAKLRQALKKHKKALAAMKNDAKGRRQDIKALQSQLAEVKKARKTATAKLQKADTVAITHAATVT